MATNYTITVGVQADLASLQKQLNSVKYTVNVGGAKEATAQTQQLTQANNNLNQTVQSTGFTYQQFALILNTCVNALTDMYDSVRNLDDAITGFKKVSDLQGQALDNYVDKLSDAGMKYGRTASEMVDAAAEFRKSGFSDKDAATLAEVASVFQNVADEQISASDAAGSLISQMKAFNISAEDAITIADRWNQVANTQAVSTNDLSSAMEVAGAGLATYGNDFNEVIALVTAGTTILQGRSLQVGRGLVTIGANLIKNSELLSQYGIETTKANGELYSTYEILQQLKPVWDAMTESEQANLGITLAGKNQLKTLSAVLQAFDVAQQSYTTSLNASGSAMRENEKYMQSLEAREAKLAAAFEDFSNRVLSSEFVGGLLDAGTALLEFSDNGFGATITQMVLFSGAALGLVGIIGQLVTAFKGAIAAFGATTAAAGPVALVIAGIVAAITAAVAIAGEIKNAQYRNSIEGLTASLSETQGKIEDTTQSLSDYQTKLKELNEIAEKDRTKSWYEERAEVEYNIKAAESYLKMLEAIEAQEAKRLYQKVGEEGYVTGYHVAGLEHKLGTGEGWALDERGISHYVSDATTFGNMAITQEQQAALTKEYQNETEAIYELSAAFADWLTLTGDESIDELREKLGNLGIEFKATKQSMDESFSTMQTYADSFGTLSAAEKEVANEYLDFYESMYNAGALTEEQEATYLALSRAVLGVSESTSQYVNTLISEQAQAGATGDALYNLVAQEILLNNTKLSLAEQMSALEDLAIKAGVTADAIATVRGVFGGGMPSPEEYGGGALGVPEMTQEEYAAEYWRRLFQGERKGSGDSGFVGGGGGGSKADTELAANKEIVATLKSELTLMQKKNASAEEQNAKMREIQDALHAQAQYMRSIGAKESEINALSAEWYDWQEKINGALHDSNYYLNELKTALSGAVEQSSVSSDYSYSYNDSISSANDKLSAQLELEEKILAVQKAQEALANAQRERTVRQYNASTGRWEWVSNQQAVQAAKESLTAADNALTEYKIQMAEDSINREYGARQSSVNRGNVAVQSALDKFLKDVEEPERGISDILRDLWKTATPELRKTILANAELFKQLGIDLQQLIDSINSAKENVSDGYVTSAVTALKAGDRATAQKLLNQAVGLYDSGGVLHGIGGIKATNSDEIVLPPNLASAMLHPSANSQFQARLAELGYLYGAKANVPTTAYSSYTTNTTNSGGVVYNINGVSLTEGQAMKTTVYDLAQISRSLALQNNIL